MIIVMLSPEYIRLDGNLGVGAQSLHSKTRDRGCVVAMLRLCVDNNRAAGSVHHERVWSIVEVPFLGNKFSSSRLDSILVSVKDLFIARQNNLIRSWKVGAHSVIGVGLERD